jgi:dienelactone hydrolase
MRVPLGRTLVVAALLILACVATKRIGDWQTFHAIRAHDTRSPLNVTTLTREQKSGYIREEFTFDGCPVLAMIPAGATKRHPAIILLYGIGMNMKFADDIGEAVTQSGFALFVPEQLGRGKRRLRGLNSWQELAAFRRRILLTTQEARRLADVVEKRPDIDPQRIYLWGASFGAMTGCASVAYDPRFKAAVFTLSGGDLQKMIADTPARKQLPRFSWMKVAAPVGASLLRPFDPIWHVGKIAPRPLLFQNARNDDLIPRSGVEALYEAAGQPKEILWYESTHDHQPRATIEKFVRDALGWLQERDRELVATSR